MFTFNLSLVHFFLSKQVDLVSSYLATIEKVRSIGICTINPTDGHRLENGQEQQTGPAAGVVIIDLKHVDTSLNRWGKSHFIPIEKTQRGE